MESALRLDASWVDYSLVAMYFVFVLGIGWAAKGSSFLFHRFLPFWPGVTGMGDRSSFCLCQPGSG